MFALLAALCAGIVVASAPATSVSGTLLSVGATASGAVLAITQRNGSPTVVTLAPDVVIRERETNAQWQTASVRDLKTGEPLTVRVGADGLAHAVDAEYELVFTRAVVVQDGYLVGTDGTAHKLVGTAASAPVVPLGTYVALHTDAQTGDVFDLESSTQPFAGAQAVSAHMVALTLEVQVPNNTPAAATVYVATNAQSWTPNAIRMKPEPGNRWAATLDFAAGTVLQYKYTRGSWTTVERDASGNDISNRSLTVAADRSTQQVDDVVARWADLSF